MDKIHECSLHTKLGFQQSFSEIFTRVQSKIKKCPCLHPSLTASLIKRTVWKYIRIIVWYFKYDGLESLFSKEFRDPWSLEHIVFRFSCTIFKHFVSLLHCLYNWNFLQNFIYTFSFFQNIRFWISKTRKNGFWKYSKNIFLQQWFVCDLAIVDLFRKFSCAKWRLQVREQIFHQW